MSEKTFHQIACEYIDEEVNVITRQNTFEGKLLSVGRDVLVLHNKRGGLPFKLFVRIEEVVALYRSEPIPRGPFGFFPQQEQHHFDRAKHHESAEHHLES